MPRYSDSNQPVLDRLIRYVAPGWAIRREVARRVGDDIDRLYRSSQRSAVATRVDASWPNRTIGRVRSISNSDQASLRDRAQQLDRENALASSLLNRSVDFSIGRGMSLQASTEDEEWNREVEALWTAYWEQPEVTGLTGLEVERHAWRCWHRDGDVGAILLRDGKVQLIEGGQLRTPDRQLSDDRFYHGVEVNGAYRPVRFHLAVQGRSRDRFTTETQAIDARDFVWLPRLKRHIDVRGTPVFAPVFGLFDQIDGYVEASVIAARVAACFSVLLRRRNPTKWLGGLGTATNSDGVSQAQITLEPGAVHYVDTDEDAIQVRPEQPGQQFEPVVKLLVRFAGLEAGFPIELALLDFSSRSFTSARAALIQAQRGAEPLQTIFIKRFMSRIYRWRVSKWIKEGLLSARDDAWRHRFIPYPWQLLDPTKEIQGRMLEVDAGFATVADQVMAMGRDPNDVMRKRSEELARMKELGIPVMRTTMATPVEDLGPSLEADEGAQDQGNDDEPED